MWEGKQILLPIFLLSAIQKAFKTSGKEGDILINIDELRPDMKIRFNVTEGNYNTFWHFSPNGEYKIYTLQGAYPNAQLVNPEELIIWCDEIDMHRVKDLNINEWDLISNTE